MKITGKMLFRARGFTLVEILIALVIASMLVVGAAQLYAQSRAAFMVNESVAQVQETAQFALDTIESDLHMASFWGRTGRAMAIEGRSVPGDMNPRGLPEPADCGEGWALNVALPVSGFNNRYALACPPASMAQAQSDILTVRRASTSTALVDGVRLQIQSALTHGEIFLGNSPPPTFSIAPDAATGSPASVTHNLVVSSYYVAANSRLVPGAPTLRRKRLGTRRGIPSITDEEVVPGIENLQIHLGIDLDADNAVDRYVNPGQGNYDPTDVPRYLPGARILTARIWLLARGIAPEPGIVDTTNYRLGDVNLGQFSDGYRRVLVSRTIMLRNVKT